MFYKIKNVWKQLRQREVIAVFNDLMRFCRLSRFFYAGESGFYILPPFREQNNVSLTAQLEYPFRLDKSNSPKIIPELLKCLEGSTNYSYLSDEEIRQRFEYLLQNGSTVWLLCDTQNNAVAGFTWTTPKQCLVPCSRQKILIEFPPQLNFLEFSFVAIPYRRKGLFIRMFSDIRKTMPEQYIFCDIDSYNVVSVAAHRKIGFERNGYLRYYRVFNTLFASFCFGTAKYRLFLPKRNKPLIISKI